MDSQLTFAGICQQLASKVGGSLTRLSHDFDQRLQIVLRRQSLGDQARATHDSNQKVVEVMRNAPGEQADALQLLAMPRRFLVALLLRDVHRDSVEAPERAGFIRKGPAD